MVNSRISAPSIGLNKRKKIAKLLCPSCFKSKESPSFNSNENELINNNSSNLKIYITFNGQEKLPFSEHLVCYNSRLSKPLPEIPTEFVSKTKKRTPLIPDLLSIFNLPYYWGKIDRFEAETELNGLPDGSFLLRDSAQDEFMFSVSFNRFGRTIHVRVQYKQGVYSFDKYWDGTVSIPLLLNNFKNSSESMFYHPLCIIPVYRKQPFSLQQLCLSTICSYLRYYEDIYELNMPHNLLRQLHFSDFKIPVLYSNFYNETLFTITTNNTNTTNS